MVSTPIFYVDRSEIRDGRLGEVKAAMEDLAEFISSNEPQLLAYGLYLNESDSSMSVVAVHADSTSMELHMEIGGPKFRAFAPLIVLQRIDVYGSPNDKVMEQLRSKAADLGGGTVNVHPLEAGFFRPGSQG